MSPRLDERADRLPSIGIDCGGTFTDLIYPDPDTGELRSWKIPTARNVVEGVIAALGHVPAESLQRTGYFVHGSTIMLNTLLQRSGPTIALLLTEGFRDLFEIRGSRDEPFNLHWRPDPPLVPRNLRYPIRERMRADGTVDTPISEADVRAAVDSIVEMQINSIAVVFLNAYANPDHERMAERIARDSGFAGEITLSHLISAEYREYPRLTTSVVDAYVRRAFSTYVDELEDFLRGQEFGGRALITRSGGGALTLPEARARPFETISSGPVAGVEGAARLARDLELNMAISADVGGTSFDAALIMDGRPTLLDEGRIIGMPIQTSWVDVRSIGAGGGSIAYLDDGGSLRVGPRSAGASPGPAAYGRGGTEPTVTDAACVLGMLAEGHLAGELTLDRDAAERAVGELAKKLNLATEDVARGVIEILSANMANLLRELTIEEGQDPRDGALIAFGGAGPLLATALASELDIPLIVVPLAAGNFSAWGMLQAELVRTLARTLFVPLDGEGLLRANALLSELFSILDEPGSSGVNDDFQRRASLSLRYRGQEHTLPLDARTTADGAIVESADSIRSAFQDLYERTYSHNLDLPVEILSARATLRARASDVPSTAVQEPDAGSPLPTLHRTFSLRDKAWRDFAVVRRSALAVDEQMPGPAIIHEHTTTTYVDVGHVALVHASGCLLVSRLD